MFCRFIDTADYVGKHLATSPAGTQQSRLSPVSSHRKNASPASTNSDTSRRTKYVPSPPTASPKASTFKKTSAVVHYDLAWNPTRHEQRKAESLFGQKADIVRAVTIYGKDNQIDGVVPDVLLRKTRCHPQSHRRISPRTRLIELRRRSPHGRPMLRGSDTEQLSSTSAWNEDRRTRSGMELPRPAERTSHTSTPKQASKPEEVAAEVTEIRDSPERTRTSPHFVDASVRALGGIVNNLGTTPSEGLRIDTGNLPFTPCNRHSPRPQHPLTFYPDPPAPRKDAVLNRTDPDVAITCSSRRGRARFCRPWPRPVHTFLARRTGVPQ